jgi:hypothetical protein
MNQWLPDDKQKPLFGLDRSKGAVRFTQLPTRETLWHRFLAWERSVWRALKGGAE